MSSRHSAIHKKHDSIQHQIILDQMLQDESNKKCADCWARNPRWASWNLGIFLCIRCAGIHRNLGVHISRVKSVGLDSWTEEQITSMQLMGNANAAIIYEANLPENFRYSRPENDQTLEKLIRDKYERKMYFDKATAASSSSSRSVAKKQAINGAIVDGTSDAIRTSAPRPNAAEEIPHPDGKPLIEF